MNKTTKKIEAFLFSLVLIFSLAACGAVSGAKEKTEATAGQQETARELQAPKEQAESERSEASAQEEKQADETNNGSDVLVVYFSRTGEQYNVGVIDKGNTAIVAGMIADRTGSDSFEILPEEDYYPYTYDELTDVAMEEQRDNARPAYAGEAPDLSQYSTIFIGAPVWWGDWPMICYTFFEDNSEALTGKVLIPFSTHEGSGLSGFDKKLSSVCPESSVKEGLAVRGSDAQNNQDSVKSKVDDWLSDLGY